MLMPPTYYYGFWEANPRLWARCQRLATEQMLKSGWKRYAGKFEMVMQKKALKFWRVLSENSQEIS